MGWEWGTGKRREAKKARERTSAEGRNARAQAARKTDDEHSRAGASERDMDTSAHSKGSGIFSSISKRRNEISTNGPKSYTLSMTLSTRLSPDTSCTKCTADMSIGAALDADVEKVVQLFRERYGMA